MKAVKRISVIIFTMLIIIVLSSCNKGRDLGTKFYFSSYKTFEKVPFDVFLEDEYFDAPSTTYNQHLATASACLALAGGSSVKGGTNLTDEDYKKTSTNIKYFFEVTKFSNFMSNSYGESSPTTDSFGVYCAMKKHGDYTIIGVGVRGFGYLSEWSSNFKLGNNNKYAEGFYEASTIYLDTIKDYINKYNITGKIKIWTSGFSRGAAVVNMASGRLDESLIENTNILSDKVIYKKEDIYAYCFEPPSGKIATVDENQKIYEKGENFNNIFSIVNVNDVVAYVAPKGLGFVRYGIDYYLPDILTSNNYLEEINNCKSIYNNLPNVETHGGYVIDQFYIDNDKCINFTLAQFIIKLFDHLSASIGTREQYFEKFQQVFMQMAVVLMAGNNKDAIIDFGISFAKRLLVDDSNEVLMKDLFHNRKRFFTDLRPLLEEALKRSKFDLNVDDFLNLIEGLIPIITGLLLNSDLSVFVSTFRNTNNIKLLASGHIPELLLSFMVSMDDKYGYEPVNLSKSYYMLMVDDNSDIKIETENQKVLVDSDYTCLAKEITETYTTYYLDSKDIYNIYALDKDISYSLYEVSGEYLTPRLIKENNVTSGNKEVL